MRSTVAGVGVGATARGAPAHAARAKQSGAATRRIAAQAITRPFDPSIWPIDWRTRRMTTCTYCGRANEDGAQFCIDCGKPLTKSAAARNPTPAGAAAGGVSSAAGQSIPSTHEHAVPTTRPDGSNCPFCGAATQGLLPYCPNCGRRLSAPGSGPACSRCYSPVVVGTKFCATCGAPVSGPGAVRTSDRGPPQTARPLALVLLDEMGKPLKRYERHSADTTIGREEGDWLFAYDPSMSARHALVRSEDADFVVVDAGSRNGVAIAARGDVQLVTQSRILVGDKLLRVELP